MRKLFTVSLILLFVGSAFSQGYKRSFWNYKLLLSSSNFLSDLGGKNYYGSTDPTDVDIRDIRYAFGAGLQYNTGRGVGIGLNAHYTRLSADDAETTWDRSLRQLHVRTDVIEASLMFEYTIAGNVPVFANFYINGGVGAMFYTPKAQYRGTWYDLRPLGTEGQVADPDRAPYATWSPTIPFGFGKKFKLANGLALSLDVSLRKSFTDYLDDVSGNYYDTTAIAASTGLIAAHFADPASGKNGVGRIGYERGNPLDNDNYFLFGFRLEVPIGNGGYRNKNTSCAFENSWIQSNGSTPKFRKRGGTRRRR